MQSVTRNFVLSDDEYQELRSLQKNTSIKRDYAWVTSLIMLHRGHLVKDISEALDLNPNTIRSYVRLYRKEGIEGLTANNHKGSTGYLTDNQEAELKAEIQVRGFQTSKEIGSHIKEKYGVSYTQQGISALIKRIGCGLKTPKSYPAKADPEEQEKFKNEYKKIKEKDVPIVFMDSCHPTQKMIKAKVYGVKGIPVYVRTIASRLRTNITGAIDIRTRRMVTMISKTVDKKCVKEFLKRIRERYENQGEVVVILDNASYNKAKEVTTYAQENNLTLVYVPPYSPNLNPIERVWKWAKQKVLKNKHYKTFNEFNNAISNFFRLSRHHVEYLKTLVTDNFEKLPNKDEVTDIS